MGNTLYPWLTAKLITDRLKTDQDFAIHGSFFFGLLFFVDIIIVTGLMASGYEKLTLFHRFGL